MPSTYRRTTVVPLPWLVGAVLGVAVSLTPWATRPTHAQGIGPTTGGLVAGSLAGTAISAGLLTVSARNGTYLWNPKDLLGSRGAPILLGALGGGLEGALASDRLGPAVALSAMAGLGGAGIGYILGRNVWDDGQDGWAGALIGGGAGTLIGWAAGTIMGGDETYEIAATQLFAFTIPVSPSGSGR